MNLFGFIIATFIYEYGTSEILAGLAVSDGVPPVKCHSCQFYSPGNHYCCQHWKWCDERHLCGGREYCEHHNDLFNADLDWDFKDHTDDNKALFKLTYCCEKFGFCNLPPGGPIVELCWHLLEYPGFYAFRDNKTCCSFGIHCEIPVPAPDPIPIPQSHPGSGYIYDDRWMDWICHEHKEGDCLDSKALFHCCNRYGIGCLAKPCGGIVIREIATCFSPTTNCWEPVHFGECCGMYQRCSMPICDPTWDNGTNTDVKENCMCYLPGDYN